MGLQDLPLDRDSCCVLSRDEENLTLCFLSTPRETMVQIPNRIQKNLPEKEKSTRNQGVLWNWAVLSERSPRWFDSRNMEVLDSPPELAAPGSIDAYSDNPPIFGVVRAKLLDSNTSPERVCIAMLNVIGYWVRQVVTVGCLFLSGFWLQRVCA